MKVQPAYLSWSAAQRERYGCGQEAILVVLNEHVFHYEQSRHDALLNAWAAQDRGGVYLLDTSEPAEKKVHFVFCRSASDWRHKVPVVPQRLPRA
ncbi:MAG: hypothetical protein IT531_11330 [Burkholderiales bacterium]|nr:hypothetical protein [Burkholderiales bacterium]